MNREEFARQRDKLSQEIFNVLLAYKVYFSVWPTEEFVDVINRHKDFFQPVRTALYHKWAMGLANLFDNDPRAASIKNLLKIALKNKEELVKNLSHNKTLVLQDLTQNLSYTDILKFQEDLRSHEVTLKNIKDERNQYLAHLDVNPKPLPKKFKGDIDNLINIVTAVFLQLSSAHDGKLFDWSFQENRSSRGTTELLNILKCEMAQQSKNRLADDTRN